MNRAENQVILAAVLGRLRVQVCTDGTLSPLGRRVPRGTVAVQMFVAGASVVRKWLVAPESRIAHRLMVFLLVEIVLKSIVAAKAELWVGVGKLRLKITSLLDLCYRCPPLTVRVVRTAGKEGKKTG